MGRLMGKRQYRELLLALGLLCAALALVLWPGEAMGAMRDGLKLCGNVIVPSLFPFFVLSSLVVELGMSRYLGRMFQPVMAPLFRVNGACASALALGFVGGYPVGARTAISLYQNGQCSKTEAERLLAFCNNSGPAFIFGVVGAGVFGSGALGLLLYLVHMAASLLVEAGCAVTITLRSYHHGQTVVPAGCAVVPYEKRYDAMEGMALVLSATTSPHYTVAAYELAELARPPKVLADLAIPRDIEPAVGQLPGFTLYNVDDLGVEVCRDIPPEAEEILQKYLSQLEQWENYRACLPGLERVKQAVTARVLSTDLDGPEARDLVELAVSRAVDLLSGGL